MHRLQLLWVAALLCAAVSTASAASSSSTSSMPTMGAMQPKIYTPATLKWMPGTGQMKGLMVAVLDGDPNAGGPWTVRIKVPAGTKFPVHYHNDTERLTVISGTFLAAAGMKYDVTKFVEMPAGSYAIIPAGVRHFASARTDAVIQLSGSKPFAMEMDKGM